MQNKETLSLDNDYSKKCGKYSESPAIKYSYMLRLGLLKEVLRVHSCTTLLDLGSATGDYAIDLAEQVGLTAWLLDINHHRLFVASRKNEKIFSVQADAFNIPFRDNTFDIVLALNSLRYFSSPHGTLLECRRVLEPGGLLLIIDHNRLSPDIFLLGRERARCFTAGALTNLLRTNHFKLITMKRLFILPSSIPSFLVKLIAEIGQKLSSVLGKVYVEIFILAAKE